MLSCMYGPRWRFLRYAKYVIRYHAIMSGHIRSPKHAMRFLDHTLALLCLEIHTAIDDSDGCRPLLSNTCPSRQHGMPTHRSVITIVLFGLHIRTSSNGAALDHHHIFFLPPAPPSQSWVLNYLDNHRPLQLWIGGAGVRRTAYTSKVLPNFGRQPCF